MSDVLYTVEISHRTDLRLHRIAGLLGCTVEDLITGAAEDWALANEAEIATKFAPSTADPKG